MNIDLLTKKKIKNELNKMLPNYEEMPNFSRAVKIDEFLKKLIKINLKSFEELKSLYGDKIIETYFTSNKVIKALKFREAKMIKNKKKEKIVNLIKQVKFKKNLKNK